MCKRFSGAFALMLLHIPLFALPNWLNINIQADPLFHKNYVKTAQPQYDRDLNVWHNNVFASLGALSPSGQFGADILLNLEHRYIATSSKYYYTSDEEVKLNLLKANISLNANNFSFTAGRFFYGEKDTLRPYYGLYDDFLFSSGSSLDGGELEFESEYFDFNLMLARENKTSLAVEEKVEFSGPEDLSVRPLIFDYKGTLYGAGVVFKLFDALRLGTQYDSLNRERIGGKNTLTTLSFYGELTLSEKTKIYFEYAKNGGKYEFQPYWTGDICVSCDYEFEQPYNGRAVLLKIQDYGESKYGAYELHMFYLRMPGDKFNGYNNFSDNHGFVRLGSIFMDMPFIEQSSLIPINEQRFFSETNLKAYNLGGTLKTDFLPALRLSADLYSYVRDDSFYTKDLGTEMNFKLLYSPLHTLDIILGYAEFMAGDGFNKENFSDFDKITRWEAKLTYRF